MKKITEQQARELTATKIMGWYDDDDEGYKHRKQLNETLVATEWVCWISDWNPLAPDKLHQCFEMLEKWRDGDKDTRTYLIHSPYEHPDNLSLLFSISMFDKHDDWMPREIAFKKHKSLNHAIVSAVLQAADENNEQYEIED